MAYNTALADKIQNLLANHEGITEKRMFGGLCFLLHEKMLVGILKDELVVRIDKEEASEYLKNPNIRTMDFTGRPMNGFLCVNENEYRTDETLQTWLHRCINYVSKLPDKKKPAKKPAKNKTV